MIKFPSDRRPWLVVATASDDLKRWRLRLQRMAYCVLECAESVRGIKAAIATGDDLYGAQLWQELTHEEQIALWVAPTKGGIFTTHERKRIRGWWNIQIPEAD